MDLWNNWYIMRYYGLHPLHYWTICYILHHCISSLHVISVFAIESKTYKLIDGNYLVYCWISTVNISISHFCKLWSWILKELSFARSSSNVELWSWYTIFKILSWMQFLWSLLIFSCKTSKQLDHEKIEMLWLHQEEGFFAQILRNMWI